jgi:hypothetical protein
MNVSDRIRRDVVDGVTVFWTPDAPRRVSSLQFRVGRSDELPTTGGISHVVEHLAMFGLGRRAYFTNGMVDHIRTSFFAQGSEPEVAAFLTDLSGQLASPPLERLETELRVLRTESASLRTTLVAQHLSLRHGCRGYGQLGLSEYGLHTLSAEAVAEWAATRFTRGNAVAYVSGPLPDGLRFTLPEGPRRPTVHRDVIEHLPARSWIGVPNAPGVALGIVVPRSVSASVALRMLTHRLEQRLRRDLGHSYEVSLDCVPLDASESVGSIFASCLVADIATVRDELLRVADGFASEGPTQEEIDWEVDALERVAEQDDCVLAELDSMAHDTLVGRPVTTIAAVIEELRALRGVEVRDTFAAAARRATLIDGADRAPATSGWSTHPVWAPSALAGRRLDPVTRRFWQPRGEELVVGCDGVSWVDHTKGTILTVRYEACAALVVEGPALTLVAGDGTHILVHREYWKRGADVVREIEASIPASRVVRIATADGSRT